MDAAADAARLGRVSGNEPPIFAPAPIALYGRRVQPIVWLPGNPPPSAPLMVLAAEAWMLCPPTTAFAAAAEPDIAIPGIALARLPPGTVLFGGGNHAVAVGERFLADQFPPDAGAEPASFDALAPFDLPVREIAGEALLIGRFGAERPLCWISALLPKLLLAEHAFPGRFTYIVPDPELLPFVADSLRLVALGEERIFVPDPALNLRFDSLFAIQPVWSLRGEEAALHPEAAAALREAARAIPAAVRPKIALTQADETVLPDTLSTLLEHHGFAQVPQTRLDFDHRIAAAKGANTVLVAAGADASCLAFAPRGIRVVTATPLEPADRILLAGLVTERKGSLTELSPMMDSASIEAALR